jgi:hypothetical protein
MRRLIPLVFGLSALSFMGANCFSPAMPANMCIRNADALCAFLYQCCNAVERSSINSYVGSSGVAHHNQDECREEYTKTYCYGAQRHQESLDTGRADWDHEKAEECLQEREDAAKACDTEAYLESFGTAPGQSPSNEPNECAANELLIGQVPDGDPCYAHEECEKHPDSFCKRNEPKNEDDVLITVEGECESLPGEGDACDEDGICKSGHFCAYDEDPARCRKHKSNGTPCQGAEECSSGNCDFVNGECADKKNNGEDCYWAGECKSDYCGDAGQCEDPPTGGGVDVKYDICLGDEE